MDADRLFFARPPLHYPDSHFYRGRIGFDVGRETPGACRGTDHLV